MKRIAIVLYTYQLLSVMYLNGLPTTKPLEKALKKALEGTYDVTFHWEDAVKNQTVDALVIPEGFPPILNEAKIPEIKIPSVLFLTKDVNEIKERLDAYFQKKDTII